MIAANRDVKRKLKNVPAAELTALPTAEPTAPETPPLVELVDVGVGVVPPIVGNAGSDGRDGDIW
jgi:hypothetical protein